jgi:hypothetical protein
MAEGHDILIEWTARKIRPVVILYVAGVFAGFAVVAYFILGSTAAVKALLLAAIGVIVPLVPAVVSRLDYRLTADRLERRPRSTAEEKEFETVFDVEDLDRIVPIGSGFKYVTTFDATGPIDRFRKLFLSDCTTGEVQIEEADRKTVLETLDGIVASGDREKRATSHE